MVSRSKVKRFNQDNLDKHKNIQTIGHYQVHYLPASRSIMMLKVTYSRLKDLSMTSFKP